MQDQVERLAKLFLKFPGIGERQARRFAYFILTQPESYVSALAQTLLSARALAHTCSRCKRIYEGTPGMCGTCSDTSREQDTIVVVEKSSDVDAFAKTGYQGLFFVLDGLVPIVQKDVLANTNVSALVERVKKDSATLSEVILAFPITPNGEHTDSVIRELLTPHASNFSITSLGRGLSTGAELEYADSASLSASLKKRE